MNDSLPPVSPLQRLQHGSDRAAAWLAVAFFLAFPLSLALANVVMALFLLAWVLAGRYRQRWAVLRQHPLTLPSLLLYGAILAGILYAPVPFSDTTTHIGKYIKLVIALMMLTVLQTEAQRRRCLDAFVVGMLITLASTYANVWLDLPWSKTQKQGWGVDHSVFHNYIAQGVLMSTLVLLCAVRAMEAGTRGRRVAWLLVAGLAIVAITQLSRSRTGYATLLVALPTFLLFALPLRRGLLLAAAALLVILSAASLSPQFTSRVLAVLTEAGSADRSAMTSTGARIAMAEVSLEAFARNPLFGSGTGSYQAITREAFPDPELCSIVCVHPHNQFLFFAVEQGLLGLGLFGWYLWVIARRGLAYARPYQGLVLGYLSVFLVDCVVHGGLWLSTESHFFAFMTALLLAPPLSGNDNGAPS